MKGISFNDYHTWHDFSLILAPSPIIEAPEPKTESYDIPGADGDLDLSEYFGEIKFRNRLLSFSFSTIVPRSEFWDLFTQIQNAIHGKKMKIVLDDDPEYYYFGRVAVKEWKADKNIGKITIDVDAEPYKYKLRKTLITVAVDGVMSVHCPNSRKTVCPKITTDAEMFFEYGGASYTAPAGTFYLPSLAFKEGDNILTISGKGNVTIEYQEGVL